MDLPTIHFLGDLIRMTHRCDCEFVAAVRVRHEHKDRTLWEGRVGIFRVFLCSETIECYAWVKDELQETFEPVIMLRTASIDCPSAAVRSYLTQSCAELHAV